MGTVLQLILTAGTAGAGSRLLSPGVFSWLSVKDIQGQPVRFQAEEAQQHQALSWSQKSLYDFGVVHSVQVEPEGWAEGWGRA